MISYSCILNCCVSDIMLYQKEPKNGLYFGFYFGYISEDIDDENILFVGLKNNNIVKLLGRNSYEQVNTTISRKLLYEY